jgi:RNA 2',3'-cyclic 3'-phosphodiesterase
MIQVHRPFFAIRPSAEAGSMAVDAMQQQMDKRRLRGHAVPPEYLHVTLHWLGDHDDSVPRELLRCAKAAGGGVDMAPFGVGFDRIGSLGDASVGGLALTGGPELATLRQFQRALAAEMKAAGIGSRVRTSFNPHVSLLYSHEHVTPEPIAPIRWTVNELVLVDSLVGRGVHVVLGSWPLQSRQTGFSGW